MTAVFDGGEWSFEQDKDGINNVTKYFVEGPNSGHDVRLYINGNLTDDLAAEYGKKLCDFLNGPLELVNKVKEIRRHLVEVKRLNHEQRLQLKRMDVALVRSKEKS